MKYVQITTNETLRSLAEKVGYQNLNQILADNKLRRTPSIGKQWKDLVDKYNIEINTVTPEDKISILNKFVGSSDIYEQALLTDEKGWKTLKGLSAFPDYLLVSDYIQDQVPDSNVILGNNVSVTNQVRDRVNDAIKENRLDSLNLNTYYSSRARRTVNALNQVDDGTSNPMIWAKLPFDDVTLYSSISNSTVQIPAYPEELDDERVANFTQMPDLLYQYEPWQMYQSSGPRSQTFTFHLHRDMWNGDHRQGGANNLIRFCQANCYPQYRGSAVNAPTVALYVSGSLLINGVMTSVQVQWSGPLGLDNWYLEFTLTLNITEVSKDPLNYDFMMSKPLIG